MGRFHLATSDSGKHCVFFALSAAIDTAGYNGFLEFLINDEFGGWPMVQPGYNIDTSGFQWQEAAADNFRLFLTDALITTYVYIDSKDTANYAVYVSSVTLKPNCGFSLC